MMEFSIFCPLCTSSGVPKADPWCSSSCKFDVLLAEADDIAIDPGSNFLDSCPIPNGGSCSLDLLIMSMLPVVDDFIAGVFISLVRETT